MLRLLKSFMSSSSASPSLNHEKSSDKTEGDSGKKENYFIWTQRRGARLF